MQKVEWYKVHVFPLHLNLAPLVMVLRQNNIPHRITEEAGEQCLWALDPQQGASILHFVHSADFSQLLQRAPPASSSGVRSSTHFVLRKCIEFLHLFDRYPITLATIALGIVGALLIRYDLRLGWVSWLTAQPIEIIGHRVGVSSLNDGLTQGQWWRLITPIFLHFGLFHILFNGLWVWEFGRRIEDGLGSRWLLSGMTFIAIVSNLSQYWWGGPSMFGGLSGVLYGLLGWLWMFNHFRPHSALTIAPGIVGFMLIWMVLCMTGAVNFFIDGSIANAAHFSGLLAGMLLGIVLAKLPQSDPNKR